ncbi:MAG: lytic transglycosylase domain-containing protein [Bernardetiaceae bacterium]|nr:lytic transglycosylase domain-containing protein [Bernardetiaceae bacterium]
MAIVLTLVSSSLLVVADSSSLSSDSLKRKTAIQSVGVFPLPSRLEFAGEAVPLEDAEIRERLEREIIQNAYKHSATILILKREKRWRQLITRILKEQDVPEDFFYLAVAESELDEYAQSPVGALGFWQFIRNTANKYGLEVSDQVDMRRDPIASTYAACRYFKEAYRKFSNWTLVAASYNRGIAGIENALKAQKVSSFYDLYLNRETYRYVMRILALKLIMENPSEYGFNISESDKYPPYLTKQVQIDTTINDLPQFALERGITYKILKIYNPWLNSSDYRLVVPKGKSYTISLPVDVKEPEAR